MKNNSKLLLVLLVLSSTLITILLETFILTEDLYYDFYSAQLSYERIREFLDFQEKWHWVAYALIPVFYTLKFFLLSMWILCGAILLKWKLNFRQIFKVVLIAEFVWLIPSVLLLCWFGFINTDYSLADIQNFQPLSLLSVFDASNVEPWLIFPLKSLNLFEVGYVLVLALALKKLTQEDYRSSLRFTIPVYTTGLITWVVFITFLTLNLIT